MTKDDSWTSIDVERVGPAVANFVAGVGKCVRIEGGRTEEYADKPTHDYASQYSESGCSFHSDTVPLAGLSGP